VTLFHDGSRRGAFRQRGDREDTQIKGTPVELAHETGVALVETSPRGTHRISVRPLDETTFVPIRDCETRYPLPLIEAVLSVKGVAWLCDEILRDESDDYTAADLRYGLFSYVAAEDFKGKRLLDFGCGSGASTCILGRWLRDTEIVGVDLNADYLRLARLRARHYGLDSVQFLASPGPESLPKDIGTFDFVTLSAVYEHLLPRERLTLLPLVWSVLRPSGVLFINQTPNRLYPVEGHTTGLPAINYLPDGLAIYYARRSARVDLAQSWQDLLRSGIRGATTREIVRILRKVQSPVKLIEPCYLGATDVIDVWFFNSSRSGLRRRRRLARIAFKVIRRTTGIVLTPTLSIAIQKR
jgi:ubiquinone/menaquinone biosynthesis C-methylase UbiE